MNSISNRYFTVSSVVWLAVMLLSSMVSARAVAPKVSAELSAPAMEMGSKITLRVQVVSDRSVKGRFPIFDGVRQDGFASLCGDSIELGAKYESSSIDLSSGRIQTDYQIPVQAFDSGFYTLPPVAYVSGRDTAFTEPLPLKVLPVAVRASDDASDYTGVLDPSEGLFLDHIPMWLLERWWILMLALCAVVALLLFLMRYKLVRLRRKERPLPPYQEACRDLEVLRGKELWQKGMEKDYYTALVDILRRYISRRFDIHAMEMTSGQILESVSSHERIRPYLEQFRAVLTVADFAKFANMRCTPEENVGAFDEVRKFVEETKPTVEEARTEAETDNKKHSSEEGVRLLRRDKKSRRPQKVPAADAVRVNEGKEGDR